MTFGQQVIDYYKNIKIPNNLPEGVEVLYPFDQPEVINIVEAFNRKYFSDTNNRTFLIGINPGRFGGGTTGIPFTDPIRLKDILKIDNTFDPKAELSSKFIYKMIEALGGHESFYKRFYFTSVSPIGFVMNGKNLNYYDVPALQEALESYMVEELRKQIEFGANPIAFSLGMGKNIAYLKKINAKYKLFEEVRPLPHPRWVMQYRLKRVDEFLEQYRVELLG